MTLPKDTESEQPPRPRRLTRRRKVQLAFDYMIAATKYHYRDSPISNRETAWLWDMPRQTVDDIIRRTPQDHPRVMAAAVRWAALTSTPGFQSVLGKVSLEGMPELDLLEMEGLEQGERPGLPALREPVTMDLLPGGRGR